MADTRIYVVHEPQEVDTPRRMVRAVSQAQALRHVAQTRFTVNVATQEELVSHLSAAGKVEDAKAEEGQ